MSFKLSPGVYSFEEDRSQVIAQGEVNTVALVGAFKKGTLEPKRITNKDQFILNYTDGKITRNFGYSSYAAYNALEKCKDLVVKRVVKNAMYAGATVIATNNSTQTTKFLSGTTTDYKQGGKETQVLSISGPLPTGYGISARLTNDTTDEQITIASKFNKSAASNDILEALASDIKEQLDKWGQNAVAKVNKVRTTSPKQQIQTLEINRNMIANEKVSVDIEDLYLGKKSFEVKCDGTMEDFLNKFRIEFNKTNFVFAYVDSTQANTLIITAVNAGSKRISIEATMTKIGMNDLKATIKETQAGHGIYDDRSISIQNPDNIQITYDQLSVFKVPLDAAAIDEQITGAINAKKILGSDRSTITAHIETKKPILDIAQLNTIINDWAEEHPYLQSITIMNGSNPATTIKVGNTLSVKSTLSNGQNATSGLSYVWLAGDQDVGHNATLTLTSDHKGKKITVKVTGYRQTLQQKTQLNVEA